MTHFEGWIKPWVETNIFLILQTRKQCITSRKGKQRFWKLSCIHVCTGSRVCVCVGSQYKIQFFPVAAIKEVGIHTISSAFQSLEWHVSNDKYVWYFGLSLTLECDLQESLQSQEQALVGLLGCNSQPGNCAGLPASQGIFLYTQWAWNGTFWKGISYSVFIFCFIQFAPRAKSIIIRDHKHYFDWLTSLISKTWKTKMLHKLQRKYSWSSLTW